MTSKRLLNDSPLPKGKSAEFASPSKRQAFVVERIARRDITGAPYNPRQIDPHARRKLKEKIKRIGLVEPLVFNRRTGNLVSGHQRLSILDELNGGQDYEMDFSVIDVDEATEKEMNVFLNNTSAMGTWDIDMLHELIKGSDIHPEAFGFDEPDVKLMFDDPELVGMFASAKDPAAADIDTIRRMKESRKEFKEQGKTADLADAYVVVLFKNEDECSRFMGVLKLPADEKYIDGARLAAALGLDINQENSELIKSSDRE